MSRNAALNALLAKGKAIVLPNGLAWGKVSRRLSTPDNSMLPALFQVEMKEVVHSKYGQIIKREIFAMWVIYHGAGADQTVAPSIFTADLIDAIETILAPALDKQTLGGTVVAAFIDGEIRKFEGDFDGVTLITIPITIVLP